MSVGSTTGEVVSVITEPSKMVQAAARTALLPWAGCVPETIGPSSNGNPPVVGLLGTGGALRSAWA